MAKPSVAIQSLRARAEDFRARAADCLIPRYLELMHKGAAHLDEQARLLDAWLPAESELFLDFNRTDR
jgi:hypothetical protein